MQLLLQHGKLLSQGLQDIGGGFEVALFGLQPGDGNGQWLLVEITEIGILVKLGENGEPILERFLLLLQAADAASEFGKLALLLFCLLFKDGNFGGIAPPKHVAAAVVEAVAIILFVPFTERLDLSSLGDGFFLPPKLLLTHAADQIETMRHLPSQDGSITGYACPVCHCKS
jgi:hypothetical protein